MIFPARNMIAPAMIVWLGWLATLAGADVVYYQEPWVSTTAGWLDRDSGEMSMAWTSTGNPGGSLRGVFANQANPSPQIDAFRATNTSSSGSFTGDYWQPLQQPTRLTLDFMAVHTVPSDLLVRWSDGGTIFFQSVVSSITQTGTWFNISLSLASGVAWNGVGVADSVLSNALHTVAWVDVQITRSGSAAQTYYMDNFTRYYDVVPEPGTLPLLALSGLVVGAWLRARGRVLKRRRRSVVMLLLVVGGGGLDLYAAGIHTETFTSGDAGWIVSGDWTPGATPEVLAAGFDFLPIPLAESGRWVATNASSSGHFVGDYPSPGIGLLGFSFSARDTLPSELTVRLRTASGDFSRGLTGFVTATGLWYRFQLSLENRDAGSWVGGTAAAFQTGLAHVTSMEIQVTRNQSAAQEYWLDDVFLDGRPRIEGMAIAPTNTLVLTCGSLRSNVSYAVAGATNPEGSWPISLGSFMATARVMQVSVPATASWVRMTSHEVP